MVSSRGLIKWRLANVLTMITMDGMAIKSHCKPNNRFSQKGTLSSRPYLNCKIPLVKDTDPIQIFQNRLLPLPMIPGCTQSLRIIVSLSVRE